MKTVADLLALILVSCGIFLFCVSTLGLFRMPDVYTRLHATSKGDTLGSGLCLLGAALYMGWSMTSLKLLLIVIFIWVTSPTASHLIGKAAYRAGVKPACGQFPIYDATEKDGSR